MPLIKDSPPILDSSGYPANGELRVRMSAAFDAPSGHVSTAIKTVRVVNGLCRVGTEPWSVPATPEGIRLRVEQDLDGSVLSTLWTIVPDQAELTYAELLFNRGGAGGAAYAFWWDLTGGLDFPTEAVHGDFGIDNDTGDFWRYEA